MLGGGCQEEDATYVIKYNICYVGVAIGYINLHQLIHYTLHIIVLGLWLEKYQSRLPPFDDGFQWRKVIENKATFQL